MAKSQSLDVLLVAENTVANVGEYLQNLSYFFNLILMDNWRLRFGKILSWKVVEKIWVMLLDVGFHELQLICFESRRSDHGFYRLLTQEDG